MRETEIKLSVHPSFIVPELEDESRFRLEEGAELDLRATYYDTEDLRLARSGVTLRYRSGEGDDDGWTLKLPAESRTPNTREEIRLAGSPASIPDEARELVTAFTRSAQLGPVARLRTRRRTWKVIDDEGDSVAEVADDEVSILEQRRVVARFRELEVESKGLDQEGLKEVAASLSAAGAVPAEPIPKAVRALGPRATAPPDVPKPDIVQPEDPAALSISAAIATGVRRLIRNDPLTRMGDVEGLHQQRVAARRLRSDLRTFGPLIDSDWARPLVEELRWLGGLLGQVRDLDVLQARTRAKVPEQQTGVEELFASLASRHQSARTDLDRGLRSDRYKGLLDELVKAAAGPLLREQAYEPCAEVLPPLVTTSWKKMAKGGRSLSPDGSDEAFHKVRIRAKRTRYAAEAVAPSVGAAREDAERFAAKVAAVQDVLGAHQDAIVGQEMFQDFAAQHQDDGPINLTMGRLIEREAREARETKDRFFKVWKKLDRKKNRKWLEV
jgi:inorganic triphosphatase YgiF